ncbi:MAG: YjbH domain-containing protein [Candidatus Zixiibacteriota bacterium]|nr:MAG: YjbH domain-containing protein [candidate division Zixibacteria bacterium]
MMRNPALISSLLFLILVTSAAQAQEVEPAESRFTLYDIPPRWLVDMPTAGTLPRGHYNLGVRLYPRGGGLGYADIGISSRFTLGLSYGGEGIISDQKPNWNGRVGFSLKFRLVDELEYFPAVTLGFTDQGYGAWYENEDRYTFKSRGFYAVASRSFYFYKWTSGWHAGINRSLEATDGPDDDLTVFGGFDATFDYNLALVFEYDAAINDDSEAATPLSGKGRGYLNMSVKWLFAENLELEFVLKDLLVNRRAAPGESNTFSREVRMTYIDAF